jgi:hypothetical protein
MLGGLSHNTGLPIKFKSVAISSTCLDLSTLFGSANAASYGGLSHNDLRVPEHCKKPEIELND